MTATAWALLIVMLIGDAALIWFLLYVYRRDSK